MWPDIPDSYQKLPESDSGSFRYTRSRDYQTPTRHTLLGHQKRTFTQVVLVKRPLDGCLFVNRENDDQENLQ